MGLQARELTEERTEDVEDQNNLRSEEGEPQIHFNRHLEAIRHLLDLHQVQRQEQHELLRQALDRQLEQGWQQQQELLQVLDQIFQVT